MKDKRIPIGATIKFRTEQGRIRVATVVKSKANIRFGSPGFIGVAHEERPRPSGEDQNGPRWVWGYNYQVVQVLSLPGRVRRFLNWFPTLRAAWLQIEPQRLSEVNAMAGNDLPKMWEERSTVDKAEDETARTAKQLEMPRRQQQK